MNTTEWHRVFKLGPGSIIPITKKDRIISEKGYNKKQALDICMKTAEVARRYRIGYMDAVSRVSSYADKRVHHAREPRRILLTHEFNRLLKVLRKGEP